MLLTRKFILDYYSQKEIIERFFNIKIEFGKLFISPLRDDNNPTCSFHYNNGNLMFKDFRTGFYGDCFSMIGYRLGYTQNGHLEKNDLQNVYSTILNNIPLGDKKTENRIIIKSKCDIIFEERKFENYDLDFWKRFKIHKNLDLVSKYFIPVKYVYINGRYNKNFDSNKDNPTYAFYIHSVNTNEEFVKIYKPLDKNYKWRTYKNSSKNDLIIQGLKQLKTDKSKLLTKSLKDSMNLSYFGINSYSFNAESIIPDKLLDKTILYYGDNDLAGINACQKFRDKHNLKSFIHNRHEVKDFSDALIKYDLGFIKEKIYEIRSKIHNEL